MLMALDMPLPEKIFAHGWWTMTGEKMSKSLGNVINPLELIKKWSVDSFRYFLLRQVTFGMDGNFSKEQFKSRYETDLANELGNLLNRVLSMINKYNPLYSVGNPDGFDKQVDELYSDLDELYGDLKFNKVLDRIWEIVKAANIYIEEQKPWELNKNGEKNRLAEVLTNLFEALKNIAVMLSPFMPETSVKIKKQMGVSDQKSSDIKWCPEDSFKNIREPVPLFPKN
jgi:methionyl-tRNA synthetase